jgi:hypothetical protein
MIIVALKGGLGNQMFQYAAARNLCLRLNTALKFDLSFYKSNMNRQYRLSLFGIDYPSVSTLNRNSLFLLNKLRISKWQFYFEKHVEFNQSFHQFKNNTYLDGYFQSEKYFLENAGIIRNEFVFPSFVNPWINNMDQDDTVSIHIRRGDYISNPETFATHGTCSIAYYHLAMDYIKSKLKNPWFFVFSDDMDWVKKKFMPEGNVSYIDQKYTDLEEMYLMSTCRHQIIANSSFSWWAAWLNKNPEKMVVTPEYWFNNPVLLKNDIVPENWIKMNNK